MATPNVGKVELSVGVNASEVEKQLAKNVFEELKPAMAEWHKELERIQGDIKKVNTTPLDKIAKEIGAVKQESLETSRALTAQKNQTKDLAKLEEKLAETKRLRRNAVAKANRETKRDGQAAEATNRLIARLTNQQIELVDKVQRKKDQLVNTNKSVLKKQGADEKRFTDLLEKERSRRLSLLADELKGRKTAWDERLKAARDASKIEYNQAYAHNNEMVQLAKEQADAEIKEAERAAREQEAADKALTRAQKAEHNRRIREWLSAERKFKREQNKLRRQELENSLFESGAQFGKKLGGINQLMTPIAGAGMVVALAKVAAAAANASQALIALPAGFLAAQAAAGTFQMAMYGVEDAVQAALDPDIEPDALADALNKLAPAAQQAVLAIREVFPQVEDLYKLVQAEFFDGMGDRIRQLFDSYMPMARELFGGLAGIFNEMLDASIGTILGEGFKSDIGDFIDSVLMAFKEFQPAIVPLTQALGELLSVGGGALPVLADAAADAAVAFADFIKSAEQSGDLKRWVESGVNAVIELSGVVGHLIETWFEIAPVGERILPDLVDMLNNLIDALPGLISLIAELGGGLEAATYLLKSVGEGFQLLEAVNLGGLTGQFFELLNPLNLIADVLKNMVRMIDHFIGSVGNIPLVGNHLKDWIAPDTWREFTVPGSDDPTRLFPGVNNSLDAANRYALADKGLLDPATGGPILITTKDLPPGLFRRRDGSIGGIPKDSEISPAASAAKPGDTDGPSDSERRKAIEDAITVAPIDPFAKIGGVSNQPGFPGRPPLQVNVQNLPKTPGFPGLSSMMPGMVPRMPGVVGVPGASVDGEHPQITAMLELAKSFGATTGMSGSDFFGKDSHVNDGLNHPKGLAGDFSNGSAPTAEMRSFAQFLADNFGDLLNELIYTDPLFKDTISMGKPYTYTGQTAADHTNHVHASVSDENAPEFMARLQALINGGAAVPTSYKDGLYDQNGPLAVDPTTGEQGYFQVDTQAVRDAGQALVEAGRRYDSANEKLQETLAKQAQNLATEQEVIEARNDLQEAEHDVLKRQEDLDEKQRGKWNEQKRGSMDYSKLPKGDPRRMLAGMLEGMGGDAEDIEMLVGGAFGTPLAAAGAGVGQATGGVTGDIIRAAAGTEIPGPLGYQGVPTAAATDPKTLAAEGNPLVLAQMAGIDVPDYSRQGGDPSSQNLDINGGAPGDSLGRMYSDTAALIDRTFTNQNAEDKARHDQVMAVLNEVKERLGTELLAPIVEQGVTAAFDSAGSGIGAAIGEAAGPIIAADIAAALPQGSGGSGSGSELVTSGAGAITSVLGVIGGKADGGAVVGPGTGTSDSILARLSNGEWVLTAGQVKALGGFKGVQSLVSGLPTFATGGGVNVDKTVGADFFGMSQLPVIGAVINLLIAVLLRVIDVQIEARDTLNEISSEFRDFRGDFQAFDASGRLMNDTSGLVDRTGSSEQAAADERIRILKLVLEGLIKYIVEKVIVPIGKAVGNALVQAGAGAAGGAISAAPGGSFAKGAVEGVITAAGSAGIEIVAEIGTDFALAAANIGLEAAGQLIQTLLPGLSNAVFGGNVLAALFDPLTGAINGIVGGVTALFGGIFGGLSTLIPGLPFDEGGVAVGTGLMPKATLAPERVLSPHQTMLFDRMVSALESGTRSAGSSNRTEIHAPFTVTGGEQGGRQARDRLLALMS